MRLINRNPIFEPRPFLTKPIAKQWLLNSRLENFDKDGYEIERLERFYYSINSVKLNTEIQEHSAPAQAWYIDGDFSEQELILDHCMILTRYAYDGEAKEQIEEICESKPVMQKLLRIRPKWGIDFSLDYITHDTVMEVLHIEQDFLDYNDAVLAKTKLEDIVDNTDWEAGVKELIERKSEWENLCSDDHSDYKAKFFGWHRAFDNKKNFS